MDGSKVGKGLLGAFLLLVGLVAIIGGLFLNQYIYSIILGAVFQVVQNQTLPVTTATEVFLNSTESTFFSVVGNVNSGALFAAGLIAIGVILIVFGGLISFGYGKYREFRGKGRGGDMGY